MGLAPLLNVPLPVGTYIFPAPSACGPDPELQIPPCSPSGTRFSTVACVRFDSLYPITQLVYGVTSQCDDQLVYTIPFASSRAARSLCCAGRNVVSSPEPEIVAVTSTGP